MSRSRHPTAEELALWRRAMGQTAPLPEPMALVPPAEPPLAPAVRPERRPAHDQGRRSSAALDPHRPVGLDRRTWLRLKRGQVAIEQTLDRDYFMNAEQARDFGLVDEVITTRIALEQIAGTGA